MATCAWSRCSRRAGPATCCMSARAACCPRAKATIRRRPISSCSAGEPGAARPPSDASGRMTRPLNVALVGYGYAGRVFHAPLVAHTPGLHLRTVVSREAARVHADFPQAEVVADPAAAFAQPDIDLVVIAAPNAVHAPLAVAALQAGRHVLVDKPFATTLEEARQVASAAQDAGRIASVFQNRRWDADFLALRGLVESGALGEVVELHSHFDRFRPQVPDRWRERAGPGAGLWFDFGPHLVDQVLQLFGPPLSVQADIAAQR